MATLRFADPDVFRQVTGHLFSGHGDERFVFLLCRWRSTPNGPALITQDAVVVDPSDVVFDVEGWSLSNHALDRVINAAAARQLAVVEAHNHAIGPPRFSSTDRSGLRLFAEFMLTSFPDRPYAATVWAGEHAYGEWFARGPDGTAEAHAIDRIVLAADRLSILNVEEGSYAPQEEISKRQTPVFGDNGQRTLRQMRVAIVGLGGTGSHMALTLAYLGVRDFVLVDSDRVEPSNLNRFVIGTPADIGLLKVDLASRSIRSIAPGAKTVAVNASLTSVDDEVAAEITGCDLVIGCVDDDGPRLLLNRLAVNYCIPYVDVATGITMKEDRLVEVGGRVTFVTPVGPCLSCTGELDINEVRTYFMSDEERERSRRHGYVSGRDIVSPSVVSLNGLIVHTAVNELCLWVAGYRHPTPRIDVDLLGNDKPSGPRTSPRRGVSRRIGCPECGASAATA